MSAKSPFIGRKTSSSDLGFPLFAPGQMLQHHDLAALADYTRQVTQLMLRSLFGCGVVCGLCVEASFKCNRLTVVVRSGVALDCEGNLINVPKATTITIDPDCDVDSLADCLWVVLRGYHKCCAPRPASCSCDDEEVPSAPTREQYWYEIQVRDKLPECVCSCLKEGEDPCSAEEPSDEDENGDDPCRCVDPTRDCYQDHYAGRCACCCGDGAGSQCEWILLARLDKGKDAAGKDAWTAKHRLRRFVRPVLMRDPGCGQPEAVAADQEQDQADETFDVEGDAKLTEGSKKAKLKPKHAAKGLKV